MEADDRRVEAAEARPVARSRIASAGADMIQHSDTPLRRLPLAPLHRSLGARMTPFAGYDMPLQYRGILEEHRHARDKAAMFDVSHMGQAALAGPTVEQDLERLVVADLKELPVGGLKYTLLTNNAGGVIDDLIVVNSGGHSLSVIVNAARKDLVFDYLRQALPDRVSVTPLPNRALLALQGPASAAVLGRMTPAARLLMFMTGAKLSIGDAKCWISRSGYTGEDGFEIALAAEDARNVAELLLHEPEVAPVGLGARDTLRLEAGFCLWGQDIDETTTPVEAGVAWTIGKRRRLEGGFPGDWVILQQLREPPPRRRFGLVLDGRAVARSGAPITASHGRQIGAVTSGAFSPTLGKAIAVGYVESAYAQPGTPVAAIVRGRATPGSLVALPFVPHRYHRTG